MVRAQEPSSMTPLCLILILALALVLVRPAEVTVW